MKIILFSLFITLGLMAEATAKPKITTCQLKKVIKNGWTDTNQTLNKAIIKLGEIEIPNIISKLNLPLKPDENKSAIIPFPKFELTRDDYVKLFLYTKYLESKNKINDVINIYVESYRGLRHIKMSSHISFIYLIALNIEINKSLNNSLNHEAFSKEEKNILYQNLSTLMIIDNKKLYTVLKAEKNILLNYVKMAKIDNDYILDNKHLEIFKKQWKVAANKDYTFIINHLKNNNIDTIIAKKEKERNSISLMTHVIMIVLKQKIKLYNLLSIDVNKQDYLSLTDYRIKSDLSINTTFINKTIQNFFELKENNKKLLKRLSEQ